MRTEMDIMHMDERQRLHWLEANRATLIVVGVVWLLIIAFELSEGRDAGFFIAMVPVFAALRLGFSYYYARDRDIRWVQPVLFVALFALGHWMATVAAWVGEFTSEGWLWFVPPDPSHGIWTGAARVLEFPLITVIGRDAHLPDWLAGFVTALNSLIWAGAALLVLRAARAGRSSAADGSSRDAG
jgi:hypothetical protein